MVNPKSPVFTGPSAMRAAKYLFEGLAVAVVALLLGGLTPVQTIVLASTAAAAFAILDVWLPAVCITEFVGSKGRVGSL